jgi:putative zinc finger protein
MTEPLDRHLDPHEIATYVDGNVTGEARASIDAHLAACAECRAEVAQVSQIVRTAPTARGVSRRIWIPAVAAAALALLWVGPRAFRESGTPEHRDDAVTATVAPRAIAPVGVVDRATDLVWSSVPYANNYRVRLFDADGTVLWEREAADTVVPIPDSIALRPQLLYYWRVEARTGFDRRAESDMVEFRLQRSQR